MTEPRDSVVVVSTFLTGEEPVESAKYDVLPVECKWDFSYWAGVHSVWQQNKTIINVEHDMQFDDEHVDELVECPYPACAWMYLVYPTKLQKYIYPATRNVASNEDYEHGAPVGWVDKNEKWADWSSIGFCKITPDAQTKSLDKMFWQWFEHSINRSVTWPTQVGSSVVRNRWHLHWPIVRHHHDYEGQHGVAVPDHLW